MTATAGSSTSTSSSSPCAHAQRRASTHPACLPPHTPHPTPHTHTGAGGVGGGGRRHHAHSAGGARQDRGPPAGAPRCGGRHQEAGVVIQEWHGRDQEALLHGNWLLPGRAASTCLCRHNRCPPRAPTPPPFFLNPQVLVEAELPDGDRCSALLQNAETVRLVGPAGGAAPAGSTRQDRVGAAIAGPAAAAAAAAAGSSAAAAAGSSAAAAAAAASPAEEGFVWQLGEHSGGGDPAAASRAPPGVAPAAAAQAAPAWRATSVSELAPGDRLFVLRQAGARHTGVAIQEAITER